MVKLLKPLPIETHEKVAKGFQHAFWAGEAFSIGLNCVLEFLESAKVRTVANAAAGAVGADAAGMTMRALRRSQAHLMIAALYYGTKLFAKYGKRTHLIWPKVNESKYTQLASRTLNVISSPNRWKDVGLAALQQEKKNGGLGLGVEVVETDSPSDQRKAKLARALDRYAKGLEGVSLAGLTTFFFMSSKRMAMLATHEMKDGIVTQAGQTMRRQQAFLMISAIYWGVRLIGSRRKNMEKLFPGLEKNAAWNGAAGALGLIASPWRAAGALLQEIVAQEPRPASERPPKLAEVDKPPSEKVDTPVDAKSNFELAG